MNLREYSDAYQALERDLAAAYRARPGAIIRLEPGEKFEALPAPRYFACQYCARTRSAENLDNCAGCGAPPSLKP
jgi:hypothetical protein